MVIAGCAFPVNEPPTGQPLRTVSSAKVSFAVPPRLQMRVYRGSYGGKPQITREDIAHAERVTMVLVDAVRKQVPAAIETELRVQGIAAGEQAHIRVQVDDVSDDGGRESIRLTMYVYYPDNPPGTTPWSVKISGNTHTGTDAQAAADRIAGRAVELLVEHGLISRKTK